ncbi:MAG: hypothetical protein JW888_10190 [Pirellulales bacterium]|nr:hypothetical protein [Pirellulales bacterium]
MAVGLQIACFPHGKSSTRNVDWTRPGHVHLVGIGGSGTRALARVLSQRGWRVSGSDVDSDGLEAVLPPGTFLRTGHHATGVPPKVDVVVHSDAIGPDNPELRAARSRSVATLSYFETVGQLMQGCHGLAVAGTHGKSTTTAITAWILVEAGRDPTVVCGAATLGQNDGGRDGQGPLMLAEACEYRANFLKLRPRHAIILGIEPDHFDCYANLDEAERAYGRFAASIAPDGLLLVQADCAATRRAAAGASCRVETFGLMTGVPLASRQCGAKHGQDARGTHRVEMFGSAATCDWSARPIDHVRGQYRFDLLHRGQALCQIELPLAGEHNMLNAVAAAALAWHQGVEPAQIAGAIGRFPGVRRRLEPVGAWRGVTIIDDFAHHPTELTATLTAVHQMHPDRRVCCVFQPHQVSRTTHLLDEFAASLHNGFRRRGAGRLADRLWVSEIFRAREPAPSPESVTSADLADRVRRYGHDVATVHRLDAIGLDLENHLVSGDVLLTIGAGNIWRVLDRFRSSTDKTAGRRARSAANECLKTESSRIDG